MIKLVNVLKYAGYSFHSKVSYADLLKEIADRERCSIHYLPALCSEVKIGNKQIETMLILNQSALLP